MSLRKKKFSSSLTRIPAFESVVVRGAVRGRPKLVCFARNYPSRARRKKNKNTTSPSRYRPPKVHEHKTQSSSLNGKKAKHKNVSQPKLDLCMQISKPRVSDVMSARAAFSQICFSPGGFNSINYARGEILIMTQREQPLESFFEKSLSCGFSLC